MPEGGKSLQGRKPQRRKLGGASGQRGAVFHSHDSCALVRSQTVRVWVHAGPQHQTSGVLHGNHPHPMRWGGCRRQ